MVPGPYFGNSRFIAMTNFLLFFFFKNGDFYRETCNLHFCRGPVGLKLGQEFKTCEANLLTADPKKQLVPYFCKFNVCFIVLQKGPQ